MKIVKNITDEFLNTCLILGFFDGVHLGHKEVISSAVKFAKENGKKTMLLTFKSSPAKYFNKNFKYIFSREINYKKIEELGVDYLIENDFSNLADISAENYLKCNLAETFHPIAIFTGFNYTFGKNKVGTTEFLVQNQDKYNYKYFCVPPVKNNGEIVSSSCIKNLIENGQIEHVNKLLASPFEIISRVVKGNKIGRTLGFPTANINYPKGIIKIPYGVYYAEVLGRKAILNWGIKPTFGENKEVLEVHIIDFNENIYGKNIKIKIIDKIRDEKKFQNVEELKLQIKKDLEQCLKL